MWDEEMISPLRKRLLAARILDLTGTVDPDMATYVRVALAALLADGSPDIEVHITSNGGSYEIAIDLVDAFRHYPGNVTGKVFGLARSAGGILLQGCDLRLMARHARFRIHRPSEDIKSRDIRTEEKWRAQVATDERAMSQMCVIFLCRAGDKIGLERLTELCDEDCDLDAQTAINLGFVDGIIQDKELKS